MIEALLSGGAARGEVLFSTAGEYEFEVPPGVKFISAVCVGGGGSSISIFNTGNSTTTSKRPGGGGGALAWENEIPVTPGEILRVVVGAGGRAADTQAGIPRSDGGASFIARGATDLLRANGGKTPTTTSTGGAGGTVGKGQGGRGGNGSNGNESYSGGGGGAGGYSGNGGNGGISGGLSGTGGGGGGGAGLYGPGFAGDGGGVGLYGEGPSGAGGPYINATTKSSGTEGSPPGPFFGAGQGGPRTRSSYGSYIAAPGQGGGVRIVWPGTKRKFPSTKVG